MDNKCVLPFINHDYQTDSPCCILSNYKNKRDQQQLIEDHKNNKKSNYCSKCWSSEEAGIRSKRQRYNDLYKKYLPQIDRNVKISVIPTGNICNLSCIICNPSFSTAWIKKYQNMHGDKRKVEIIKNINSKDIENINKLDHIEFIGGETLKSASLWDYLKKLDKNTSFSLQTNGTVILLKDQIDLLKSFSNFNICFSVDGYDNIFEYIRQPASWKDVQKNISIYKEHFGINKLSYYLTINNLNIFYIDRIVFNLYKILPTNIDLNFVFHPSELCYNNLTKNIGSIVEKNNPAFFKNFNIQWVGNKETIKKLFDNLKKQDEYSGKKFQNYLPELYELLIK